MTALVDRTCAALLDRILGDAGAMVLPAAAAVVQEHLRARRVELHLVDRQQKTLQPAAATPDDHPPRVLEIAGSAAGAALIRSSVHRHRDRGGVRTYVPIAVRGWTLGMLMIITTEPLFATDIELRRVAEVLALLLIEANGTTDAVEDSRRPRDYSLNAELQWKLLPPTGTASTDFGLHALIEPAPLVTSDLFDWVHNDGRLWSAVLDATGRGVVAAQACDLAIAALRNARRAGVPLPEQVSLADQAVHDHYRGRIVVRALVLEIDLQAETARAVDAGTAVALRRRRGQVDVIALAGQDPLGFIERTAYRAEEVDLAPADVLLVVSDGALNVVGPSGTPSGLAPLAGRLAGSSDPADLPRQLINDLRRHAGGPLDEDATVLVVDWHAGLQAGGRR